MKRIKEVVISQKCSRFYPQHGFIFWKNYVVDGDEVSMTSLDAARKFLKNPKRKVIIHK